MNNINVVYTPWANLKKTGDMDVGQIGFHRQKEVSRLKTQPWKNTKTQRKYQVHCNGLVVCHTYLNEQQQLASSDTTVLIVLFHIVTRVSQVKIVAVEKKINEMINRLEKTKDERYPDLAAEKESRDREERNEKKAQLQDQKKREKDEQKRRKEMEELKWVGQNIT